MVIVASALVVRLIHVHFLTAERAELPRSGGGGTLGGIERAELPIALESPAALGAFRLLMSAEYRCLPFAMRTGEYRSLLGCQRRKIAKRVAILIGPEQLGRI